MSSEVYQPTQKNCDVCGDPLEDGSEGSIHVLEVPYHSIMDMRRIDANIADELLRKDGRLAYHSDCNHPIKQYLPGQSQVLMGDDSNREGQPEENLMNCSICGIPVLKSVGECGRCGHVFEE